MRRAKPPDATGITSATIRCDTGAGTGLPCQVPIRYRHSATRLRTIACSGGASEASGWMLAGTPSACTSALKSSWMTLAGDCANAGVAHSAKARLSETIPFARTASVPSGDAVVWHATARRP